jgi:hypothetical protein
MRTSAAAVDLRDLHAHPVVPQCDRDAVIAGRRTAFQEDDESIVETLITLEDAGGLGGTAWRAANAPAGDRDRSGTIQRHRSVVSGHGHNV